MQHESHYQTLLTDNEFNAVLCPLIITGPLQSDLTHSCRCHESSIPTSTVKKLWLASVSLNCHKGQLCHMPDAVNFYQLFLLLQSPLWDNKDTPINSLSSVQLALYQLQVSYIKKLQLFCSNTEGGWRIILR